MAPQELSLTQVLMSFFIQMALGGLAGWFLGQGLVRLINW
jgi:cell volume regulation protein A